MIIPEWSSVEAEKWIVSFICSIIYILQNIVLDRNWHLFNVALLVASGSSSQSLAASV